MVSTSLGLLSSIAGKYLIDIVTGYQMNKAGMIFGVMAGSFAVSLILNGGISRIMVKLNTNISNDIRADLFEQILDVSWLELSKYQNGDMLSSGQQCRQLASGGRDRILSFSGNISCAFLLR